MLPLRALSLSLLPDPFYRAITIECASTAEQLDMLDAYFDYSLLEAQRTGRCVLADVPAHGASAWLLPRSEEIERRETREKHLFMERVLGPLGSARYHAIVDFMAPLAAKHVPADAWYLSIVGVHPDVQGRGLGRTLLSPTLDEATAAGHACYLETFTPENLGFYERLGFAPVADFLEPTTGSPYVIMRRDAPPTASRSGGRANA